MNPSEFTSDKKEILKSITEILKEKTTNVVSTSINDDINLEKKVETFLTTDTITSTVGTNFVYIKFYFSDGFAGDMGLIVSKSITAQIADKMLMGEGDAEFDEMEHLDAIQEITNQILGAVTTELSGVFEFPIAFSEAEATVVSLEEFTSMTTEEDLMTQFGITILDKSDIFFITNAATFDNIINKLTQTSDEPSASVNDEALEMTTIGANMLGEVSSGKDLGLLMDVRLPVSVELGRKRMFIRDILKFSPGQVVELPKLQGEPVDLYVNNKKFATGEVVVIAENFGIRIKELIKPDERLRETDAWREEKYK